MEAENISLNMFYTSAGMVRILQLQLLLTAKDARGLGAGRLVCLAALHSLSARGYKTAVLSTDDERIPAISLYYSLGFRPIYTHGSHKERWEKVLSRIVK